MTEPHRQIYINTAKPEDFENIEIFDWIEGVGEITTEFEKQFVRSFGASHSSRQHQIPTDEQSIPDYEHCGRMSSDGEHQCNYRGGNCRFIHTKNCKDYIKCDCEYCSHPIPNDEQSIRQDEREKVLDYLDEWVNCGENLTLFKWELRVVLRELRSGKQEAGER